MKASRTLIAVAIAAALPLDDVRHGAARDSADAHLAAGWDGLASGDFAGAHWLASFALLALDA